MVSVARYAAIASGLSGMAGSARFTSKRVELGVDSRLLAVWFLLVGFVDKPDLIYQCWVRAGRLDFVTVLAVTQTGDIQV